MTPPSQPHGPSLARQDTLFLFACLLCAVPVLASYYPAMVDMPQHAAQVSAVRRLLAGSGPFLELYELNWFTPYWLGYGLVLLLAEAVGIVWAFKLVLAAAVCAFPWAAGRFCRRMGCPPSWNWLLLPLPFGFAYQWGFFNFIVAATFGFLFLHALLDLREHRGWKPYLKVALWLHLLFFAHVLTAAFFCILAGLLLASPWKGLGAWIRRCLPIAAIVPVAVAWVLISLHESPTARTPLGWSLGLHRLTGFLPSLVSAPTLRAGQLLGLLVLAVPFLWGARLRREPGAWAPFVAYVAWMLAFPQVVGGTFFTYERFGLFGLPLYLACFTTDASATTPVRRRTVAAGLVLVSLAMLGWHGIRASIFDREATAYRAVMEHAEPNKRILLMTFTPTSRASYAPLMLHMGCWYQAEKDGLCEFNFAGNWVTPARFRESATRIRQGFEWLPHTFDWPLHDGEAYDYYLVKHPESADSWLREKSGGALRLLARKGEWQLYTQAGERPAQEATR